MSPQNNTTADLPLNFRPNPVPGTFPSRLTAAPPSHTIGDQVVVDEVPRPAPSPVGTTNEGIRQEQQALTGDNQVPTVTNNRTNVTETRTERELRRLRINNDPNLSEQMLRGLPEKRKSRLRKT